MKNLLVTGAAGGIGSAIASEASKQGYKVGLIDSDEKKLIEVQASIENSVSLPTDITNEASVLASLELFDEQPDALVNCAGIVRFGGLLDQEVKDFKDVLDVNLLGCFIVSCAVARLMVQNKVGNIINISSISGGKHPALHSGAYAASKAGIYGFTKSVAKELGSRNIRSNAIAPGFIATEMTDVLDEKVVAEWVQGIPLKRAGKPEEVADLCVFLGSDRSTYITGQVYNICGGMSM